MTHLTIDLDYWDNRHFDNCKEGKQYITFIFKRFKDILVVNEHHEILPFVNTQTLDKIINVDFHSDITYEPEKILNEGTWANFINNRKDMSFEWHMPNKKICLTQSWGRCDNDQFLRPVSKKLLGYKKVAFVEGLQKIDYNQIASVSISLSREWTNGELEKCLVEKRYWSFL
ncbi:MAG TPA: hypothetical protein VF941_00260 [Clostridia bacterium]